MAGGGRGRGSRGGLCSREVAGSWWPGSQYLLWMGSSRNPVPVSAKPRGTSRTAQQLPFVQGTEPIV